MTESRGGAVVAARRDEDDVMREREADGRPFGRAAARGGISGRGPRQARRVKRQRDDGSAVADRVPDARRDGGGQVPVTAASEFSGSSYSRVT